jgi:hypothetical protein
MRVCISSQQQNLKSMKNALHTSLILLCLITQINTKVYSQSLSGNMKSNDAKNLAYGNVDVYKNDKKVASVIADALGNFTVHLDTGYYRVEFKYVGHTAIVRNIHITGNITENAKLNAIDGFVLSKPSDTKVKNTLAFADMVEDAPAMSEKKEVFSGRTSAPKTFDASYRKVISDGGVEGALYGQLTAGEVNDFAKWIMWNDLNKEELSKYKNEWHFYFSGRYTLQVVNEDNYPIVDALVQMKDEKGKIYYQSKTDNTGKAELWRSIAPDSSKSIQLYANIYYQGNEFKTRTLLPFELGINTFRINALCGASNMVDIAFVVDATGSMGDEISYLKSELNDIMFKAKNKHTELNFNFASLFYRDINDDYLTRKQDFTDVLSESVNFINQQEAGGGGDYEEAVEVALNEAIEQLKWSEVARTRILFLILDAPPHNTPENVEKMKKITQAAAERGIRIVPIAASGINKSTEYLMRILALGTNGTYTFITNHSGIGATHIEPSTDTYKVEILNQLLVRLIDAYTFVNDCNGEENLPKDTINATDSSIVTWNVWPNPSNGTLKIQLNCDVNELFITDITGKIMERHADIHKNRILETDIGQYAKGIYLITFVLNEKRYTKKVILS